MRTARVEAFSDGVIAILITVMVLELHIPAAPSWTALGEDVPVLLAYLLSFVYLGIYWNNHHHMFHAVTRVDGGVLWANLHLLFWLSLIPFVTAWMGENHFATIPTAAYGVVLLMTGLAYLVLQTSLIKRQGVDSMLATAVGSDFKGKISAVSYLVAIPAAFVSRWLAGAIYVGVALLWLVPDRRIERAVDHPVPR